jgi:hypothetical protein
MPLSDYAVKFGRDPHMGLEGKNTFPFFYSLVNHNDVDWTVGATPPDLSTYSVNCVANTMTPWYVRLDPDFNYKLLAIKYSAYYAGRSDYAIYENFNAASIYIPDIAGGTPYSRYLQVSLSVQGSGSQCLFGGQNIQAINNTAAKIPLAVECMQGYDYGFQAMRCEYLLPLQSILSFEFTNTHATNDIRVAAMMYGWKIRL